MVVGVLLVVALAGAAYALLRPRGLAVEAAPGASDPACVAVATNWPTAVAGRARVAVADEPRGVAAWGDPAIVARCGVASPGPTTHDCIRANGIDWVDATSPAGGTGTAGAMVFTTYGRTPAIEVIVPAAYAPEPLVLGAFAGAAGQISQGEHRCS